MDNRSGWAAIVLAMTFLTGCQTAIIEHQRVVRILTELEMDGVTAGSAVATNDTAAHALGSHVQTNALADATARSGASPIGAAPYLDDINSQTVASASSDGLTKATLSSHASVEGINGGASIDVTADGSGTSRAQVDSQFYGFSTNRVDIVFGSAAAVVCCGSDAAAQVTINSRTGGPYRREILATPTSDTPGQTRTRVDVAVISSTLPILDPAQVSATDLPTRASPKY